jgi:mycothiol synthase
VARLYREVCQFEPLAELIYLERAVHRAPQEQPPLGFAWETYSSSNHDDFARAVTATYAGSLDCPRLNGRRDIEDVLAGHKAAGEFDPKLWFLLRKQGSSTRSRQGPSTSSGQNDDRDSLAGVLLMSRSTRTDAVELVYLGLQPAYRGRRLADAMMRHAFATVAAIGSRRLSLAVDSNNVPALRLYRRHGMTQVCSRLALLRDLRQPKVLQT